MANLQQNDSTPLDIRAPHHHVDDRLRDWVHERLGRHLGKFASQIERIDVRFGDENGPKRGPGRVCLVHIVLHALPPIAPEMRGETDREAFDLAAGRAERATKHALQKAGFSSKHKRRQRPQEATAELVEERTDDSLYGRREGRGPAQLEAIRAASMDGQLHTATRNLRRNTSGMSHDLEDSLTGRPSRKSTRRSRNHIKSASGLTIRTRAHLHSPASMAARASRH